MNFLFAILGAAVVVGLAACNWRLSVKTALIITVIEGGLRKWVFPQASEMIYFLKDGVLLGAYLGYLIEENVPAYLFGRHALFGGLYGGVTLVATLQVLNLSLGSVLVGLLGAKAYVFYLPLCLVLPKLFRSIDDLFGYLKLFLVLSIPIGVLGVIQFFSPADSAINVYAHSVVDLDAATFGEEGNVRVTGTFPYIAGFSVYLVLCLAFDFALLMHLRTWSWRLLFLGLQVLLAADLLMTGSRGAAVAAGGLLAGFTAFSLFETTARNRQLGVLLLATGIACFFGVLTLFPSAVDAFRQRAAETDDSVSERIVGGMLEPLYATEQAGFTGYGAGACQVACYALRDQLHLGPPHVSPPMAEGEPLRVMLELGVVGFICWYALRIYLLVQLGLIARRMSHPMLRHLAQAAFMMHALFLTGQLVTNTTFSVFYWFLAGFVFLLPELDRRWLLGQRPAARQLRPPLRETAALA